MPEALIRDFLNEPAVLGRPGAAPEVLVAEAHHRISNNLTLISSLARLQAREIGKSAQTFEAYEVRSILEEISGRIETVGRLHSLLSGAVAGAEFDLGSYLTEVAVSAISTVGAPAARPRFSAELRDCHLERSQALQLGLIVGELVTNSLKYAHPAGVTGEIRLVCRPSARGTAVEIWDDGVGFPEGFDPRFQGGLGLRVVRLLAAGLKADLEFDQTLLGLTARLDIPREP